VRLEGEAWSRYFQEFASSAFRLELRQIYVMPGEADDLAAFERGELPPVDYHYGWLDTVANAVKAGEDIRILDVTDGPIPELPNHDFWLFDDTTMVKLLYRPDGTQEGRELIEHPDLDAYLRWRNTA
jgi:hypothetical protein